MTYNTVRKEGKKEINPSSLFFLSPSMVWGRMQKNLVVVLVNGHATQATQNSLTQDEFGSFQEWILGFH